MEFHRTALGIANVDVSFHFNAVKRDRCFGVLRIGKWQHSRGAAVSRTFPGVLADLDRRGPKADNDQTKSDSDHRARLHENIRHQNGVVRRSRTI